MAATHLLESRDRRRQQARNAARHRSHSLPGEPRTAVVSRLETQRGTAATHSLESRGRRSSAGSKRSEAPQPLTSWRAEDGVASRLETQRGTSATHDLESRGRRSSAGSKRSEAPQPLTSWRAEDGGRQQARNAARHRSHSRTGEPRTAVVSRLETQRGTAATHFLESRGRPSSAGSKRSEAPQPLTHWRAEDSRRQQARNAARHRSHSPPGEPRTAVVSRLETQRGTAATHQLESRGQPSSAGSKRSEAPQPLTSWRAEDSRRQQ